MLNNEEILILKSIGDKVRFFREQKGLSQDQLSIEAEIPKNQVGRIERSEINTTVLTLYKIAKALSIDIKELI